MTVKISVLNFEGALQSAIYGIQDLALIANQALMSFNQEPAILIDVINITPTSLPAKNTLGNVLFLPPSFLAPGTVEASLRDYAYIVKWLGSLDTFTDVICGCCTSVVLLADAGMLNKRKVTTTWWIQNTLSQRYPDLDLQENEMLVDDQGMITSAGPFSYIPQFLHLIERFISKEASLLCAKIAVVEPGRANNGVYVVPNLYTQHDPLLLRATEYISLNLAEGINVAMIANALNLSERTFSRRIKERSGLSPREFIANCRIEIAKTMLETSNDSISKISHAVGFENDSSFRSAFSKSTGTTPSAYRKRLHP